MESIDPIFLELAIIIALSAIFGVVARMLKQPPIIGYLLAGIVLGPVGAAMIRNPENINALSEIGIALLLFLVGLEMDWKKLKKLGIITGVLSIIQIGLTFSIGFIVAILLNLNLAAAIVLGLTLAFSSTVIVIKLLSEKHDLDSLYGRISIGVLLVQDIVAIFAIALLPSLAKIHELSIGDTVILLAAKTAGLVFLAWFLSSWIFPKLFRGLASSQELLFVVSLAWCFVFAILTLSLGFSVEIGAFLAGVSLASLPYAFEIVGRIKSLRDFFIILFFVVLGTQISFSSNINWTIIILFTALAVVIKPLIVILSLSWQGLRRRVAFMTGISLGQMSEFSLILSGLALELKMINQELASIITLSAALSFLISPYLINISGYLFSKSRSLLGIIERRSGIKYSLELEMMQSMKDHIIIFGYHRMGYHILKTLKQLGQEVLIIDFNPEVIDQLQRQKIPAVFGDAQDEELLESIHFKNAKMIISTIPYREENLFLIKKAHQLKRDIISIITAGQIDDALEFYKNGASYVIMPYQLSGEHVADLLKKFENKTLNKFLASRKEEVRLLKTKSHALYIE